MRVISRKEWGAKPARSRSLIRTPTPELYLHHSAGALDAGGNGVWWDDVAGIQDFHMRPVARKGRGWTDIAYSFLVGGGQVFEGRGAGVAGGHTAGRNSTSHAICLIGSYDFMQPTDADLAAIAWLIRHGQENGWWWGLTGGHRNAPSASTECPGENLYAQIPNIRRAALGIVTATGLDEPPPTPEEDDVPAPDHITAVVHTPSGRGYYKVSARGGVFAYGDAPFFGSIVGLPEDQRQFMPGEFVVGMALTLDAAGRITGYMLVTNHSDHTDADEFRFGVTV